MDLRTNERIMYTKENKRHGRRPDGCHDDEPSSGRNMMLYDEFIVSQATFKDGFSIFNAIHILPNISDYSL